MLKTNALKGPDGDNADWPVLPRQCQRNALDDPALLHPGALFSIHLPARTQKQAILLKHPLYPWLGDRYTLVRLQIRLLEPDRSSRHQLRGASLTFQQAHNAVRRAQA